MKFVDDKNNEIQFDNSFNVIKEKDSIIRNIGKGDGPATFIYSETISSDDLCQLKINVKNVCSFLFAFKLDKFNRERIVDQIFLLRKRKVIDKESARIKVDKLKDIVAEHKPLFVICSDFGEFALDIDLLKEIFKDFVFFYVEEESVEEEKPAEERAVIEEKVNEIEETPVEEKSTDQVEEKAEEVENEAPSKEDREPSNFKEWLKKCWSSTCKFLKECGLIIKKDYFNFIFALVAAFLIGFTIGVGLYNAYLGKNICIFFFVAALVGMMLNAFVYRDTFVAEKVLSKHVLLDAITSVIGIGSSIGGYYLFKGVTKEIANPAPHIMMIIGIQIACLLLSVGVAYILKIFNRKKKK